MQEKVLPKPRLYNEVIDELTAGVRKDLLAQADTFAISAGNTSNDLDGMLREARTLLGHMQSYVNSIETAKERLDKVFLSSPIRMCLSIADEEEKEEEQWT